MIWTEHDYMFRSWRHSHTDTPERPLQRLCKRKGILQTLRTFLIQSWIARELSALRGPRYSMSCWCPNSLLHAAVLHIDCGNCIQVMVPSFFPFLSPPISLLISRTKITDIKYETHSSVATLFSFVGISDSKKGLLLKNEYEVKEGGRRNNEWVL